LLASAELLHEPLHVNQLVVELPSSTEPDSCLSVCDLGVHLKSNSLSAADLDHVRKGYVHNDVALASTDPGVTDRQHASVRSIDDVLGPEVQFGEYLIREALPLPDPVVSSEDPRNWGVGRVAPFDRWIEERQDPFNAI
jgi:hypothetical protein